MTPNPNPSPELLPCPFCGDAMQTAGGETIGHLEQGNCPIGAYAWGATDRAITAWNTRALSQTLPAPGEVDYAELLQTAWESCPTGNGLGLPPIIFSDAEAAHIVKSLATVAAANDEGVAEAREMAARIIQDLTGREWPAKRDELARLILRNYQPLATSRSQHEGASS